MPSQRHQNDLQSLPKRPQKELKGTRNLPQGSSKKPKRPLKGHQRGPKSDHRPLPEAKTRFQAPQERQEAHQSPPGTAKKLPKSTPKSILARPPQRAEANLGESNLSQESMCHLRQLAVWTDPSATLPPHHTPHPSPWGWVEGEC